MNKDKIVIIQKHSDDNFPINSDAFHAYLGFRKLGYKVIFKSYEDIILYELKDIYNKINKENISCAYGEVRFTQSIMKKLKIQIPESIDYILQDPKRWNGGLYYRRIYKILANKNSLKSLIDVYFSDFPKENMCFIKGFNTKHIHSGLIIKEGFDIPTNKDNCYTYDEFISLNEKYLNEDIYLWLSEFKDITSEWRLYIYKNEIVGMVNYSGNFLTIPNLTNIKYNLSNKENKDKYPIAFSIDVGFCDRKYFSPDSLVIECNDFYSIGNYGGITDELFAEMLIARWEELSNA